MKEIKTIQWFEIPTCGCGAELTEGDPYKITFTDNSVSYLCAGCGENLVKLLGVGEGRIERIEI